MKLKKIVEKNFVLLSSSKTPNQKMKMYQCKYYIVKYAHHTTRMSNHLLNCSNCPDFVKKSILDNTKIKDNSNTITVIQEVKRKREESISDTSLNNSQSSQKSPDTHARILHDMTNFEEMSSSMPKMNKFLDKMSKHDQVHAEELLAKAIYSSGIVFFLLLYIYIYI